MTGVVAQQLRLFTDIVAERDRQDAKFGYLRDYPDGTGLGEFREQRQQFQNTCDNRTQSGRLRWRDIVLEEVYEVMCETDKAKLRAELIQTAACIMCWLEALDRRP